MGCINSTASRNSSANNNNNVKNNNVRNKNKRTKNSNGLVAGVVARCCSATEPCLDRNCKNCCSSVTALTLDVLDSQGDKKKRSKISKTNKTGNDSSPGGKTFALFTTTTTKDEFEDREDADDGEYASSRCNVDDDGGDGKVLRDRPRSNGKMKKEKKKGGRGRAKGDGGGSTTTATKHKKLKLPFGGRATKNARGGENSELVGSKLAFANEDPATSPTMPNGSTSTGSMNRACNKSQSLKTSAQQNGVLPGGGRGKDALKNPQRAPSIPEDSNGDPQPGAGPHGTASADVSYGDGGPARLVTTQTSKSIKLTDSQIEFFRLLDEKIEQGPDLYS